MARRSLTPADLDPLDSAASPIAPDPAVGTRPWPNPESDARKYKRHMELRRRGLSEEEAADAVLAEDREALRTPQPEMDADIRAAVGRGSLYPQEAELVAREREMEATAESLGMPRQDTLPPAMRDAAAGDDMVGRFRFVHSPTGLRAIDTSPSGAEQRADFRKWANQEPGSDRQRTYAPQDAAAWDARVANQISAWAQQDLTRSPEELAAQAAKDKARIAAAPEARARQDAYQKMVAERRANAPDAPIRQRLAAVGMLTGGRPSWGPGGSGTAANQLLSLDPEWQQLVLSQNLSPRGVDDTTPLTVQAADNQKAFELAKRFETGRGFQPTTPEQARMLDLQIRAKEGELPAADQAISYKDKPEIHPSEEKMADEYVSERFSRPRGALGLFSSFTAAEQQDTYNWLVNEKKYLPEKAKALVANIAGKRESQSWFGNWGD